MKDGVLLKKATVNSYIIYGKFHYMHISAVKMAR